VKDYQVTGVNLQRFMQELQEELAETPVLLVTTQDPRTGRWSMARLWRAWMSTTADFMASRGVTIDVKNAEGKVLHSRPFDAEDAHELFTAHWMGTDEDGTRLSWSRSGRDGMRAATKGERMDALRQHEAWCIEKGISLLNPRESEYRELLESENA
jgi:hypothetical protein